jgi:hypothetical protein
MRWLPLAFLLAGCTGLTAAGARVHVIDADAANAGSGGVDLRRCRDIGPIQAHSTSTRPGSPLTGNFAIARTNAVNDARNQAAKAGADTLANLTTDSDYFGVTATGEAYDCGSGASNGDVERDGARTP